MYLKEVQRLFLSSFKDVLRKFQGCRNCQESFKKISQKVSRMYKESLNEVSFAILLPESQRIYPSRRRACFLISD